MFILLTFWSSLVLSICDAKGSLRHSQSNKHFISQLDEGTFEIVHPFQVRDKKERIGIDTHNYFLNATVHYKNVVIVVRSSTVVGGRLKLNLSLNEFIFLNETHFKKLDEHGESALDSSVENCYYQGTVNGDSTSFVAISTCNGLWGVIGFENGTSFGIWPLDGGDRGRRHPHVLYKTKWNRDAACGALTQTPAQFLPLMQKIKRDVTRQTKYVELAVLGDNAFMKEINATDIEGVEYILSSVNIADMILNRELRLRLSIVYAEVWTDAQRVDLHNDLQQTLSGAIDYTTGHIYHVEKDATLMFTGGFFANNEMLSSTYSSVCTARAVGIAKAVDAYSIHTTAQFIAHMTGHIVGIDHDSTECVCRDNEPCIMNKQTGAIGSPFSWEFSKCNVARMNNILQSEHVQCLLSRPFQVSRSHQCGNGMVDGDEECDCGRRDECNDPCCDPITCTLRAHAQCALHHQCCYRCQLRQFGHVCRASRSVCDVPEVCDGESGDCPADGFLVDGVMCGINGQCWRGNCSDADQQCKDLWGPGSTPAEDSCYDYNEKAVEYGNCGTDRNGVYIPCSRENRRCGTLHCKDGSVRPKNSLHMSFNLQFVQEGRQMQCKVITETNEGLVKDGTNCASGKVCIENVCLPLAQVSQPVHCPSNNLALQCSGHGDCTTTQKCLCFDGWTGTACDIRSNSSRRIQFIPINPDHGDNLVIPPFKVGRTLETSTLLGILLLVGIMLLLLLICLLFCYRRRSSAEMHRAGALDEKMDESESQDNYNRIIKFGAQPSYREEKRKRKKNKRVYDALQRITEATEERDSISLKSRESSTAASIAATAPISAGQNGALMNGFSYIHRSNNSITESLRQQRFTRGSIENGMHRSSGGNIDSTQRGIYNNPEPSATDPSIYLESQHQHHIALSHRPAALNMPSYSPSHSDYCSRSRGNRNLHLVDRNGYSTDTELAIVGGSPTSDSLRFGPSSNNGTKVVGGIFSHSDSTDCVTPPLRLQSIQMLMRRLNPDDSSNYLDDENELAELCDLRSSGLNYNRETASTHDLYQKQQELFTNTDKSTAPEPPPASADSGHPCSNYDIRESPSLFSDAFKLDLSN